MKILEVETFVEILIERIEFLSDRSLTLSSYFEQSIHFVDARTDLDLLSR